MASLFSRPVGRFIILLTIASFCSRALRAIRVLPFVGAFNASALRVVVHAVRGGGPPRASHGLGLELLRHGCPVPGRRAAAEVHGSMYTTWYDAPAMGSNGLAMIAGGDDNDPVEWTAEAWDGVRWTAVAASGMLLWPLNADGTRELYPRLESVPATGRIVVDLRAPACWVGSAIVCPALNALATTVALFAALAGREGLVRPILPSIFALNTVVYGGGALLSAWDGQLRDAVVAASTMASPVLMTWILCRRERFALVISLVPALQFFLVQALVRCALFRAGHPAIVLAATNDPAPGALHSAVQFLMPWIIGAASSLIRRFRSNRRACRLLVKDQRRYDIAWAAELARPSAADELARLSAAASFLASLTSSAMPQQLNRQRRPPRRFSLRASLYGFNLQRTKEQRTGSSASARGVRAHAVGMTAWNSFSFRESSLASRFRFRRLSLQQVGSPKQPGAGAPNANRWTAWTSFRSQDVPSAWIDDCGIAGTLDPSRPVDSLDQLYAAAAATQPILRERTWVWAAVSGGLLPAEGSSGEYVAARACGTGRERVRWAALKSVERAVEKSVRSYWQVRPCRLIPASPIRVIACW